MGIVPRPAGGVEIRNHREMEPKRSAGHFLVAAAAREGGTGCSSRLVSADEEDRAFITLV